MKIESRPDPEEENTFGTGEYTLNMTFEELQLIGAYLYVTRLGQGTYKKAAFNLITALEDMFDEDFTHEAFNDVGLSVSKVDINDTILEVIDGSEVTFEVL